MAMEEPTTTRTSFSSEDEPEVRTSFSSEEAEPVVSAKDRVLAMRSERLEKAEQDYLSTLQDARAKYFLDRAELRKSFEAEDWFRVSMDVVEFRMDTPNITNRKRISVGEEEKIVSPPASPDTPAGRRMPQTLVDSSDLASSARWRIMTLKEHFEAMTGEEVSQEILRMEGRCMEVESVLRERLERAGDVVRIHDSIRASLAFLQRLGDLAMRLNANSGTVFQEMLARCPSLPRGHLKRDNRVAGLVDLEAAFSPLEDDDAPECPLEEELKNAATLIGLVRVKIEDANDLSLAATVLEDSRQFFEQLDALADLKKTPIWPLFEQLRL